MDSIDFKKIGIYTTGFLFSIGLFGFLYKFFQDRSLGFLNFIEATHDFGRLNSARFILLAWETFWLVSFTIFFIWVAKKASSGKSEEKTEKLEEFEPKLFKIVIGALVLAAILTLLVPAFVGPGLPQYRGTEDTVTVNVKANQFSFRMKFGDDANFTNCIPNNSCLTLQDGVKYNFVLESTDTTHGFAVYDSDNVLITQAQIVPGYQTSLVHEFSATGLYSIRCAEYCGAGHHLMETSFSVN